ncbi:diguanylate cyclase domain-containing protein [Ghiorsea bivora]|uniref:diguanylate cyclase domain-containing protein n=1 Tax=Ghiorsea bivora TaxID=1485545 RepID=UPI000691FC00|nr:diguanylate cyclase [Ghiorsea bivora]
MDTQLTNNLLQLDNVHTDPVLIVGAGLGGTAMLDIFSEDTLTPVAGIVDNNPHAIGIQNAKKRRIPVFNDLKEALETLGTCSVFNMTNNEEVSDVAAQYVGTGRVIGGQEAKIFWDIISRLKLMKHELQENQTRLKAVIHNVKEGIITMDADGYIENINPAMEQIFGYAQQELKGENLSKLIPSIGFSMPDATQHKEAINPQGCQELTGIYKSGTQFPIELNLSEMRLNGKTHFVGIVRDISERKEAEERMLQLALYDQLTQLPNRTLFYERLSFSIKQSKRSKEPLALLFIDLDGFKAVNDNFGHLAGDQLLVEVSKRLLHNTRDSDVVARLGGDEFVIILNHLKDLHYIEHITHKLIQVLGKPMQFQGHTFHVGASIGISVYPKHAHDINTLIQQADSAMYQAKKAGKNRYYFAQED